MPERVQRRLLHGLSRKRLAAKAGIHDTYLCLIFAGARRPSVDVVMRLAKAMKVGFEELRRAIPSLSDQRQKKGAE